MSRFASTRGGVPDVSLSTALLHGLAPDGGLYVPVQMPRVALPDDMHAAQPALLAEQLLAPFFADDALAPELPAICREAFTFPFPLVGLKPKGESGEARLLELFHGPTAAFKDVGARFLAACHSRLARVAEDGAGGRPLTVLVATSGDTGGAVAAACSARAGLEVVVLYPAGQVSARQERQLATWDRNVIALRVAGNFDDCQRLVKEAFADPELSATRRLTSANSINIGRLLPQMVYYASAALALQAQHAGRARFLVPSGNVGNVTACCWARALGLPIGAVGLATNKNRALVDLLEDDDWRPRESVRTLANAMDVGAPSNVERLLALPWGVPEISDPGADGRLWARSIDDAGIEEAIVWSQRQCGITICPHTATAVQVWRRELQDAGGAPWVIPATAHPAKFESVVEPLIGSTLELPPALRAFEGLALRARDMGASLAELRAILCA